MSAAVTAHSPDEHTDGWTVDQTALLSLLGTRKVMSHPRPIAVALQEQAASLRYISAADAFCLGKHRGPGLYLLLSLLSNVSCRCENSRYSLLL